MKHLYFLFFMFCATMVSAQSAEWMRYPSISPDGKSIAFSYKGDIYVVPSSGGTARALTHHPAYDVKPVWSPDGKTLAFASDRDGSFDIYTIPVEGGQPYRVTYHSSSQWPSSFTPDGKYILFDAQLDDWASNIQFPNPGMSELYRVPVKGGRHEMVLGVPAKEARYNKNQDKILYYDWKGYEDQWRKRHTSSVTRDVWIYDVSSDKHTQLSPFNGEDRDAVFSPDERAIYFLTEQFGSFNVAKLMLNAPSQVTQISRFNTHPVRFLSISNDGTLAYGVHGKLYTQREGAEPVEVKVNVISDAKTNTVERRTFRNGATEMTISPNGKEVAFIVRGEVFVTSVEYGTTKRITNTPEQERSVSFSPDGKKLLYASERNNSWNLYEASLTYPEELYFHQATLITETPLLVSDKETFQASYSPDGKEVAFLEERTTLRVMNLASKQIRTVLAPEYNYSYSDGDQWFEWSPDGKWIMAKYFERGGWISTDVGLVAADGKSKPINLTNSGYSDSRPRWMMKGKMAIWFSDREGFRSHGSWGSHTDVWGMFFDQATFDQFLLSKEEAEYQKALDDEKKKAEEAAAKDKKAPKKDEKKDSSLSLNLDNLDARKLRLTIHSSSLSDAVLTPDGTKMYYLTRFEDGHDLWMRDFRSNETKLVSKLSGNSGSLEIDKDGKFLYMISGGTLVRYEISSNKRTNVSFSAEMEIDHDGERSNMFEHAWRQVQKKFYDPNIHGLDWMGYKNAYLPKLAHINNNRDFAELLAELLGELNGSHTGASYTGSAFTNPIQTASLGVFFDFSHKGNGLKVQEILLKSPFDNAESQVKVGTIIEKIDGVLITPEMDFYTVLNGKTGKKVVVDLVDDAGKKRWKETIKPISIGARNQLLYERWITQQRDMVDKLSNGKLGYVHVRGMNSASFRDVYTEALGRHRNKEGLVVDTRFNGGGWLHDDLATFLNGKRYADFTPR